jgi:thiol-disulfide isomerase/thioredoxin
MNPDLLLRALEALAIIGAGLGIFRLANWWILTRKHAHALPERQPDSGRSAIVYFTTPTCVPCKTFQRPALDRLKAWLGDSLEILEIDASSRPDLASEWGVLSVPTTFVLDPSGRSRFVNHGVATAEKLLRQVEGTLS